MASPVNGPPRPTYLLIAYLQSSVFSLRKLCSRSISFEQDGLLTLASASTVLIKAFTECRCSMLGSSLEGTRKIGRKLEVRYKELALANKEEGTTRFRSLKQAISTNINHPTSKLTQLMTKKLSEAFFGDKKFTEKVYLELQSSGQLRNSDIEVIFEPYTSKLQTIESKNSQLCLLDLFLQFVQGALQEFGSWPFQKLSSVVEIAAHVFERSFEDWMEREESFRYFSEVLVRHSLFRPPHSVCVFNYEELNRITEWWLTHFDRYYQEYQQCMASSLNELLVATPLPADTYDLPLSEGRPIDKTEVLRLLQ